MASGDTLFACACPAQANMPPTTAATVPDQIGIISVLAYAQSTDGYFGIYLPRHYAGGGITLTIIVATDTANSGNTVFQAAFERHQDGVDNLNSASFATAVVGATTAVPGTHGIVKYISIAFTAGAQLDSLAAGEHGRLQITRNTTNDTVSGNVFLVGFEAKET